MQTQSAVKLEASLAVLCERHANTGNVSSQVRPVDRLLDYSMLENNGVSYAAMERRGGLGLFTMIVSPHLLSIFIIVGTGKYYCIPLKILHTYLCQLWERVHSPGAMVPVPHSLVLAL